MKRARIIVPAVITLAFASAALGADWVLAILHVVSGWLRAVPAPTNSWAKLLAGVAWPTAVLLIVCWLFEPLEIAAMKLANRLEVDDVKFWGVSLSGAQGDTKISLDREEARQESSPYTPSDVTVIEALCEFGAGDPENATRLFDWIRDNVDPELYLVDFLTEPVFADARRRAYIEIVGR